MQIGEQVWMAENLNYKTSSSWCYDNNINNCNKYGKLYKWDAALTACTDGWHLPVDEEWKTLEIHLGMSRGQADGVGMRGTDEGKKLKSTSGWPSNRNGIDEVGFMALPGGSRGSDGGFNYLGNGNWWSATSSGLTSTHGVPSAYGRFLDTNVKIARVRNAKTYGYSVRCVRDSK